MVGNPNVYANGVMRSTDGGDNWENKSTGLYPSSMLAIAISPNYLYGSEKPIFVAGAGGVYRSINNGDSWETVNGTAPNNLDHPYASSIAISPDFVNDRTLFVGLDGQGCFKSVDGGENWQRIINSTSSGNTIIVSPNFQNDHTVIAKGYDSGNFIAVSRNAGATWDRLPLPPDSYSSTEITFSPDFASDQTIFVGVLGADGINGIYSYTFALSSNQPPVAKISSVETVHLGASMSLDGSSSYDPDGETINFSWAIKEQPEGSDPILVNATSSGPTFSTDQLGNYVIELVVTDSRGATGSATVTVSTYNTKPVADAGGNREVQVVGTPVTLDGTGSYDVDGDIPTFEWTITEMPVGSTAILNDSSLSTPSFTPDIYGVYRVQLIVRDHWVASDPVMIEVSFLNLPPVANAGSDGSVMVNETFTLDGSKSSDPNNDQLTYTWSLISSPKDSLATILNPFAAYTSITPDLLGEYRVQLAVSDGVLSNSIIITILAASGTQAVVGEIQTLQGTINTIPEVDLKNRNMGKTLNSKLSAVIADIEAGNYQMALDKLQNDLLPKTDGCATTGEPDKNDWIKSCEEQAVIYSEIQQTIIKLQQVK